MVNHFEKSDLPADLESLFDSDYKLKTTFTTKLHFLFKNLILEYFKLKKRSNQFSNTADNFGFLADDINGIGNKQLIKDNFLRNLSFPPGDKIGKPIYIKKLIIVYNYLTAYLENNGLPQPFNWYLSEKDILVKHTKHEQHSEFLGAKVINSSFKLALEKSPEHYTKREFYLSKITDDCQWYGIIKDWDYKRTQLLKVKKLISGCFDSPAKVAAIIYGDGGVGKSIFLRRLAIECCEFDFTTLWIINVYKFCRDELSKIANSPKKYLLIFDDWTVIQNKDIAAELLTDISNFKNIRLIIGDRDVFKKPYRKFSGKEYKITTDENEKILNKILTKGEKKNLKSIVYRPNFFSCPIYYILFVLLRDTSLQKTTRANTNENFISQFTDVVLNDINTIYDFNSGLSKALYYWSCLYDDYKLLIAWSTFLELADYFNGDTVISERFSFFDKSDPIGKILSYYFHVERLLVPKYKDTYFFVVHHDLLIPGLIQLPQKDWYYNKKIKFDILSTLTIIGREDSAIDLWMYLKDDKSFKLKQDTRSILHERYEKDMLLKYEYSFLWWLLQSMIIKACYKQVQTLTNGVAWACWLWDFKNEYFTAEGYEFETIIADLIDLGCHTTPVLNIYQIINNGSYTLDDIEKSLENYISNNQREMDEWSASSSFKRYDDESEYYANKYYRI